VEEEEASSKQNMTKREVEDGLGLSMLIDSQNNQYILTKPRDSTIPRADHHFIKASHGLQHGLASEAVSPASHWTPAFLLPEASLEHSDLFSQKPFSFCFILLSQALTMAPRLAWISLCSADWP
jgi:hypothetical protein